MAHRWLRILVHLRDAFFEISNNSAMILNNEQHRLPEDLLTVIEKAVFAIENETLGILYITKAY